MFPLLLPQPSINMKPPGSLWALILVLRRTVGPPCLNKGGLLLLRSSFLFCLAGTVRYNFSKIKDISKCSAVDGLFLWQDLPDVQPRVSTLDPRPLEGLQQEKAQEWGWESTEALRQGWRPGGWSAHLAQRNAKGVEVHRLKLWT